MRLFSKHEATRYQDVISKAMNARTLARLNSFLANMHRKSKSVGLGSNMVASEINVVVNYFFFILRAVWLGSFLFSIHNLCSCKP